MSSSNAPLKIGLVGCGHVAFSSHLPAIHTTPGLKLHAIFDPNPTQLERARCEYPGTHLFRDLEPFYASGLDAIVITSSAPYHLENVLEAARHRLPVLCEKPLAMTRADGEEMVEAMKDAGQPLYTAFCYRFNPAALKIRELIAQGAIGRPRSLRLIYNWDLKGKYERDIAEEKVLNLRREGRMREGGPMIDCGTHQIDLAAFWLNSEVTQFSGHGAWVEDYVAPDHVWLHLDHACGAHTMVEMSFSYHHVSKDRRREFVYEVIGTKGVIRYDRETKTFQLDHPEGRELMPFHPEKDFEGMYVEFAAALRRGHSSLLASAEEGVRVTEIASLATEEAISRRQAQVC